MEVDTARRLRRNKNMLRHVGISVKESLRITPEILA